MQHPILFFGTSPFAVPILERLAKDPRFEIKAVVTQPDRPVGRHALLKAPPVKEAAERLSIPVLQFESVKSPAAFSSLTTLGATACVVASFGQIISTQLLDAFPHGMVNVHASLLPKYRGASPIAASIAAGDAETGITIMKMDAQMDHGPTLAYAHEQIRSDDTTPMLEDRLAALGAETLPDVLIKYLDGQLAPTEQDHAHATGVQLLSRDDGRLDPTTQSAETMERLVRAYTPWPGTYIEKNGKRLKVLEARLANEPGYPTVNGVDGQTLCLMNVQPEGKPPMDGAAFLRGNKDWFNA